MDSTRQAACSDPAFAQQRGLFREGSEAQQIPQGLFVLQGHLRCVCWPRNSAKISAANLCLQPRRPAASPRTPGQLAALGSAAISLQSRRLYFLLDRLGSIRGIKGTHFKGRPAGNLIIFYFFFWLGKTSRITLGRLLPAAPFFPPLLLAPRCTCSLHRGGQNAWSWLLPLLAQPSVPVGRQGAGNKDFSSQKTGCVGTFLERARGSVSSADVMAAAFGC